MLAGLFGWPVVPIGTSPATLVLPDRYMSARSDLAILPELLGPAVAIAALGAIESLLAGVVAGRMVGKKLAVNQELVAQGIGNLIIPFFGGVPATAAITRMSVGVKAGGVTRLTSLIHAVVLLVGALACGPLIGRIPLAALAGVLLVTAFRMNEWHAIRLYPARRLKGPVLTMIATIALDLTQAIVVGVILSLGFFLAQVSRVEIVSAPVDRTRLHAGHPVGAAGLEGVQIVYITGALYFGATGQQTESLERLPPTRTLILSMRGVPMIDASSVHALEHLWHAQAALGRTVFICGAQKEVRRMLERFGLVALYGEASFFWDASAALEAAHAWFASDDDGVAEPVASAIIV